MFFVALWLVIGIGLLFAFVVFFGAPYLPTLKPQVDEAFELLSLKEGQTIVELGCGDGRLLIAAGERGLCAVGYELNPILALLCWARTRKYHGRVRVVCGNFWNKSLPDETDAIFVFLLDRYMIKLDKKITQTYKHKSVKLLSFAFEIPSRNAIKTSKGLFLYEY